MSIKVTVLSGSSELTIELSEATVQSLKSHPQVQALRLGDNVDVKSNGAVLSEYAPLEDGATVSLTQRKLEKGC